MANTVIQLRKSSTPSAKPTSLEFGELAINYADGKLYYKNTNSQIAEISGAGGGGGNAFGTVNANSVLIVADTAGDVLTLEAGQNIAIEGDAINDKIIISSIGVATNVTVIAVNDQANLAYLQANTARNHANAAFTTANASNGWANTVASASAVAANTLSATRTDAANGWANTISDTRTNAANGWANTVASASAVAANTLSETRTNAANGWANTVASASAVAANTLSATRTNAANGWANTVASTSADAANTLSLTRSSAANLWTNTVFGYSNTKFLANSTGTFAGSLTITNDLITQGNVGIGIAAPSYRLEVAGSFAAQTKSFVIEHQSKPNTKLVHGSLEGPENGVYVRGKSKKKTIELPDYWSWLVDEETITVNLTPIGKKQDLFVKEIKDNKVIIGGARTVEYYYTVYAERKDVPKLIVEC